MCRPDDYPPYDDEVTERMRLAAAAEANELGVSDPPDTPVPNCQSCGASTWLVREEAVAVRFRRLWVSDGSGYPTDLGWRTFDVGDAVVCEAPWDPTKARDEVYICANGHEPDAQTLEALWDLFSVTEPVIENDINGPYITSDERTMFEKGAAQ